MNDVRQGLDKIDRRSVLAGMAGVGALGALGALNIDGFAFAQAASSNSDGPIASTEYGKVRGIAGKPVLSFRGVPYAGPAGGANRFMPPTKATPWKGVCDAVKAGPRSMQIANPAFGGGSIFTAPVMGEYFAGGRKDAIEIATEEMSEDCLVLNVLTPALKGKRPVMIYIHGGGYAIGSGALTLVADRFVEEQDVVLVSINHRLNVFGYTYLGALDPKYADSGNVGQLDLIAALHWVRDNISNFGGDPSNGTVFGESGGGGKISTLMAMPDAKGLFHRAIVESGSMLSVRTKETATEDTAKLLASWGITPSQVGLLESMPTAKLLSAINGGLAQPIGPVVDGRSVPHQTWDPGAPLEAAGVSLLVGNCKDEGTLFAMMNPSLFSLDWVSLKEQSIKSGLPQDKVDAIIDKYRADYPNDTASDLFFRIGSDRGARRNAIEQALKKVKQQSGSVYVYNFAWDVPIGDGRLRAFHTSELPLALRLVLKPESEELSQQIGGAWAGFARAGDPNHAGLPHWEKYSAEKQPTMIFNVGKTALVDNPAHEELALLASCPRSLL